MPASNPLLRALIGGWPVSGLLAARVLQAGYFAADRFELVFASSAPPLNDPAFALTLGRQSVVLEMASMPGGFVELLEGQIDNVQFDYAARTVVLSGRDLSARLIDSEIAESFANQTASQIATQLAARRGLVANVAPTSGVVGQYYALDHAASSLGLFSKAGSEWDLLVRLAQAEGFALSVVGNVLNFGPPAVALPVPLAVQDCMALTIDVAASLPVMATVQSWNTRQKAAFSQTAGAAASGGALGGVPGGASGAVHVVRPNLTSGQAKQLAAVHLAALARHGTVLRATMPGEMWMRPQMALRLAGTGSTLDQVYLIERVTRELDGAGGFVQTIQACAQPV